MVLLGNAIVAAAKIAYGLLSGSLAIQADGFHSILDGANNVVALAVMRIAAQPPDEGHPYGHRKFEVLGSLVIGVLVLFMILRVGEAAWSALRGAPGPSLGVEAYGVMLVTLAVNLVVTTYEQREGRRWDSTLLTADARHTLADVFVTLAVLVGVLGVRLGWGKADAVASIGVLALMAWLGYTIIRRAVQVLADESVIDPAQLASVAESIEGVQRCHRARSRGGSGDVKVDVVIEVDPEISVKNAHSIADRVEEAIQERFSEVDDVVVHVEPLKK